MQATSGGARNACNKWHTGGHVSGTAMGVTDVRLAIFILVQDVAAKKRWVRAVCGKGDDEAQGCGELEEVE